MAAFARIHFLMFLLGLIYGAAFAEQCDGPRQLPVRGMMLQRHIYDKRKARSGYAECLFVCREMFACQSFNFVISNSMCEFNNSSKEASPDDFVADPDRYYMKLDVSLSRASLNESSILSGSYLDKVISYLNPVVQTRSRFVRCWHAQTDGWASSTFHSNCDGKGPTVTIIKVGSYIFGGYTDVSWSSVSCGSRSSSKAFIFSLYNFISGDSPIKLEVKPGYSATYTCSGYGPTFGDGHDIYISDNAASNQQSSIYSHCGYSYPRPPGYSYNPGHPYYHNCVFYAGSQYFTPTDIEVFYEATY